MIKEIGSVDVGLFQRTWNKQSAREHQIIGRKASALKNIFDLGPEIVDSILGHVNLLGWQDAVWSDDNLASKKICPRYQFPSKSKIWTTRVRTSEESMLIMIKRVNNVHERLPQYMRKKMELSKLEEMAERAAAVINLANEALLEAPIQQDQVKECFINAWASGDEQVDAEVHAALIDKSDTFKATEHIPTLKTLAYQVCFAAPEDPACAILHNTLQADCFQLLMRTLKFEVQTHKVWLKKCSGWTLRTSGPGRRSRSLSTTFC